MSFFSHRPVAKAQALIDAQHPHQALVVIEAFIATKQKKLPYKRCSRLDDAIFLRDRVIKPKLRDVSGDRRVETAPRLPLEAIGEFDQKPQASASPPRGCGDTVASHHANEPFRSAAQPDAVDSRLRIRRARPASFGGPPQVQPRVPRMQSRPLSTVSMLSAHSLDYAIITQAHTEQLSYATSVTEAYVRRAR